MVSTSIFLAELGKLAISWGMELRRLRKQDGYVALVEETPLSPLDKEGGEEGGEEPDNIHDAYMASAPTDQRWTTLCRRMTKEMLSQDCMTLSLTALLYTLQYTLQLFSLSVITPATHQALMQNKVLATSLLSVFLLGRSYRWQQWASIGALCAGVAVLSLGKSSQHTPSTVQSVSSSSSSSTTRDFSPIWLVGVGSVVTASFFGSGAAVLLERVLKNGRASIWLRNAQLALFGVLISGGAVCYQSYRDGRFDPLQHFDAIAWSVTLARSLGGFLIALVLQTSDAVMKGEVCGNAAQTRVIVLSSVSLYSLFFASFFFVETIRDCHKSGHDLLSLRRRLGLPIPSLTNCHPWQCHCPDQLLHVHMLRQS